MDFAYRRINGVTEMPCTTTDAATVVNTIATSSSAVGPSRAVAPEATAERPRLGQAEPLGDEAPRGQGGELLVSVCRHI